MFISLLQKVKSKHKQPVRTLLHTEPDTSLNSNWTPVLYNQSCKEIVDVTKNNSSDAVDYMLSVTRLSDDKNLKEDYKNLVKALFTKLKNQKSQDTDRNSSPEVSEHVYEM